MPDLTTESDYDLIRECLRSDSHERSQECFAELVRRYKNLVYSIILRMHSDRDEAADLAQDVFVKIYKNLDKYYPDYKFSTWVMRITTNHVIDARRKKRAETVPLESVEYEIDSGASPEAEFLRKEQKEQLAQVVEELPDMYKIPIVLYHQQGLSYQEISEITNEPLSKVKNRIFRGRKMLKDSLVKLRVKESGSYGLS
ncbi:MAG: sigma-70 family RNA polymerase sigma factor [Defluviitaleaceae bacterium]|nr:sigma-70 family RNA polymerase sigma factor [Defluviitaleaceae bacterium]